MAPLRLRTARVQATTSSLSDEVSTHHAAASTPTQATKTAANVPLEKEPPVPTVRGSYRHRRSGLTALSMLVLGFWLYHANVLGTPSTTNVATGLDKAPSVTTTIAKDPLAEITSILTQGTTYDTAHGSFTGFAPALPSGALLAAGGPGMVVSLQSGTTCLYSGILPTGQRPVLTDPTDQACTAALVAQAQATLTAEASATSANATASVQSIVTQVQTALTTWSLAGGGTFLQVPASLNIANTTLVSKSATTVTVKVATPGACTLLTVQATSPATGTQSSCS